MFELIGENTRRETVTVEVDTALLATLLEDACKYEEEITGNSGESTRALTRILRFVQNAQYEKNKKDEWPLAKDEDIGTVDKEWVEHFIKMLEEEQAEDEDEQVVAFVNESVERFYAWQDCPDKVEPQQKSYKEYMDDLAGNHNPRYEVHADDDDVEHTVACEECERVTSQQIKTVLESIARCGCFADPFYTHPAPDPHREGMDTDGQSDEYPLAGA